MEDKLNKIINLLIKRDEVRQMDSADLVRELYVEQTETNRLLTELIELWREALPKYYQGYARWSPEQEEYVLELWYNEVPIPDIVAKVKETFNITRTEGAIRARVNQLGVNKVELDEPKKRGKRRPSSFGEPIDITCIYDGPPF